MTIQLDEKRQEIIAVEAEILSITRAMKRAHELRNTEDWWQLHIQRERMRAVAKKKIESIAQVARSCTL